MEDGFKLDRNVSGSPSYSFIFAEQGVDIEKTNTDVDSATLTQVGSWPTGVNLSADGKQINITSEAGGTRFSLDIKAKTAETANYFASEEKYETIKIDISSLWYGISEDGTLFISPFENEDATNESEITLSATSTDQIGWYSSIANIKNVVVQETSNGLKVKPTSMFSWFRNGTNISTIDLAGLDASAVTTMSYTFSTCSSLTSLDLSSLKTVNLQEMVRTFEKTTSLGTLKLGGLFTTENVTKMTYLFAGQDATTTQNSTATRIIDMKDSFNSKKLTVMTYAFCYHKFTSLDLSGLDTNLVRSLQNTFQGLILTESTQLDLSS